MLGVLLFVLAGGVVPTLAAPGVSTPEPPPEAARPSGSAQVQDGCSWSEVDRQAVRRLEDDPNGEAGTRRLVDATYCALLGRLPDREGARYWASQLAQPTNRLGDLVGQLFDSDEYRLKNGTSPYQSLARIDEIGDGGQARDEPVASPGSSASMAELDSLRVRRQIASVDFDGFVAASGLQDPVAITPALVHGRLNEQAQKVNVAFVHLSAGRGVRVSPADRPRSVVGTWPQEIGAQVAVNGNWFSPWDGPAVSDGVVYGGTDHYYTALFGFTDRGDAIIDHHGEVNDNVDPRVVEGVSGHPTLIFRGEATTDFGTDPTFLNRHPRTVIGLDSTGDVLILVTVDGRRSDAVGMTGAETVALMKRLGAHDAVMLDGGGSSTMWIAGVGVVNRPSGGLRAVGNQIAAFGN